MHQTQFEDVSFWTDSPQFLETYYNKHSFWKNNFNIGLLTASFSDLSARMKIELPKESWQNSLLAVIKKGEISEPQLSSMLMWTTKGYFQWIVFFFFYFLVLGKWVQFCAVGNQKRFFLKIGMLFVLDTQSCNVRVHCIHSAQ